MFVSGRRGILLPKFPDAAVHCEQRGPCQGQRAATGAKLGGASLQSRPGTGNPRFVGQVTSKRRKAVRVLRIFFCAFAVVDWHALVDDWTIKGTRNTLRHRAQIPLQPFGASVAASPEVS